MSIVIIVAVVIVVAVPVTGMTAVRRRRRLQLRFGPEYDRLASEHDSKRKAESELAERERRVHDLDLQPLTDSARAGYAGQWATIQEQFVDTPADAVASSQLLVVAVMSELGYPAGDPAQMLADLSVEHAAMLGHYRAAEQTSRNSAAGTASTEDLRLAMIDYRALFRDLIGDPAGAENGSAVDEMAPSTQTANVRAADTQPELITVSPVADGPDQQLSPTNAGS